MQAFEGIRVIDFTHVLAGPFCTYQLAVMGADVIKIEPPQDPDMMRIEGPSEAMASEGLGNRFVCQNANKRAVSVDFTTEEGLEIVRELIQGADVIVENFRGGVLERHGLGYDAVATLNPTLIYCSMTGFGHTGPKAAHPAYDNVIQAFSGMMASTGSPQNHPVRVGPAVLDYGTGAQAAFAVASALFQRTRTGKGQHIDVAMVDAALMLSGTDVMDAQVLGQSPVPYGNHNPAVAGYSLYSTADGLLMIGAFTERQNQRLFQALGLDEIADSIEGVSRRDFKELCEEHATALRSVLASQSADHWETLLMDAGIPAARVRRIDEAIAHPQVQSRGVLQEATVMPETGARLNTPVAAFGYAHGGPAVHSVAPRHGEHTRQVLTEIGLSEKRIDELEARGVALSAPVLSS